MLMLSAAGPNGAARGDLCCNIFDLASRVLRRHVRTSDCVGPRVVMARTSDDHACLIRGETSCRAAQGQLPRGPIGPSARQHRPPALSGLRSPRTSHATAPPAPCAPVHRAPWPCMSISGTDPRPTHIAPSSTVEANIKRHSKSRSVPRNCARLAEWMATARSLHWHTRRVHPQPVSRRVGGDDPKQPTPDRSGALTTSGRRGRPGNTGRRRGQ